MSEQHVMIDLETLSTRSTALIVSIGAYRFDPYTYDPEFKDTPRPFYARLRLDLNNPAFHVDADTLNWWMFLPDEGKLEFTDKDRLDPNTALVMFNNWLIGHAGTSKEDRIIWSHGNFDVPILQHAYEVYDVSLPWYYRSPRDMRTIIHAAFGKNLDVEETIEGFPQNPNPHHPVYDAWHQSIMVQECFRRLNLTAP